MVAVGQMPTGFNDRGLTLARLCVAHVYGMLQFQHLDGRTPPLLPVVSQPVKSLVSFRSS